MRRSSRNSKPACRRLGVALLAFAALTAALLATSASAATALTPNDTFFPLQWADANTGQPVPLDEGNEKFGEPRPGTPGADDRAARAWQVSTGSRSIVIGEADTGIDFNHPDLAANVWSNPGGVGGCAAGTHGYNVLTGKCEPMDTEPLSYAEGHLGGHGTHVAGIMAAAGDNAIGVAGVEWQATVLPVKWLQAADEDPGIEHLIAALKWFAKAAREGVDVRVVNDSPTFEGTPSTQQITEEREAIAELGAENILFVTAAGNTHENDDEASGRYPCRLDLPNEICVTATNDEDQLPSWANYGPHTVDLAAPGVSIYSTLREGKYGYLSGGSMAAAQVSGAAALILSVQPSLSPVALKQDILENVDELPSLSSKVRTGGRLDICKALPGCEPSVVTEISPSSGSASGGTKVTITGTHLDGATTVTFGSTAATSFTVESPTSITATAPPGTGTVDVTVADPGGASAAVAGDRFTYVAEQAAVPSTQAPSQSAPSPTGSSNSVTTANASATAGIVELATRTLGVARGKVVVKLRCVGSRPCTGQLTLAVERAERQRDGADRSKLEAIGHATFSVSPGGAASVTLVLSASGRTLLRSVHGKLGALLKIVPMASPPTLAPAHAQTVGVRVLTAPAARSGRRLEHRSAFAPKPKVL